MLTRTDLSVVEAIARLGTVTQAANELCITQSAISHAMKRLEAQQGLAIWKREGRNVRLTEAGEALLSFAKRILPQFEQMEEVLQAHAKGEIGRLRIGMECYPCFQWLLKIVAPYLKAFPNVDVDVLKEFQFGGLAALFHYDIDVLITPDPLQRKGVAYLPVFEYQQMLVTSKQHPLADKPYVVPQDLSEEILLTYPIEKSRLDVYQQFLLPKQVSVRRHKTIETTEIMLQMVAAGRGVSVLPDWLVAEQQGEFALASVPLGPSGVHKTLYVGRREEEVTQGHIDAFIDMARSQD